MKEFIIRTSGFFSNLGESYKIALMRASPSDYPAHAFRCPKKPLQPDLKVKRSFDKLLMKECIRTSGFSANLGASYKIALMRAPPPFQITLLTHSGSLKNPSNRTLKLNGPSIFLPRTVDFTCC